MGKSIFEYTNYREFLRDYYNAAKKSKPYFSFRYFATKAGFKAGNILKLVMDGERNIARHSIEKFAKAMNLNQRETEFFKNLVLFNQAESPEEKQLHAKALLKSQKYRQIHPLSEAQFNFFSQWYNTVIRELVQLSGFKEDPKWIAKHLTTEIPLTEVKAAIELLLQLGLLKRDPAGKLEQAQTHLATADEVASSAVVQYHREMMKRASESIETVKREKREISSVTMVLGRETMSKIKEKIQNFRREVTEIVSGESKPDSVYQLNFQFFPVAEVPKEDN